MKKKQIKNRIKIKIKLKIKKQRKGGETLKNVNEKRKRSSSTAMVKTVEDGYLLLILMCHSL